MGDAMTDHAREALEAARALSPEDQLALLNELERSVARTSSALERELERSTSRFWHGPSIEEIIEAQGVKPVTDLDSLKSGAWPEDESIDDFLAYLYQERHGK